MAKRQPKVQYKLDMVKIFNRAYRGVDLNRKNQLRAYISDPVIKLNFGRSVINKIRENTQSGVDKRGIPMSTYASYSTSYRRSDIFKIFGKTSRVNMTLSGEMLASMLPKPRISKREVVIEFADSEQNNKAHGHVNGSRNLPKRDFFGLPKQDEEDLLRRIINDASRNSLISIAQDITGDIAVGAAIGDQVIEINRDDE